MRVNFSNRIPIIFWQTADAMRDVELVLPYYGSTTVAQQLIIVQQTTRNRILDGKHADGRGIFLNIFKDLFEG